MTEQRSFVLRWQEYRAPKATLFWSCILCVILTMVVGFTWGGWVTNGSATKMTEDAVKNARTDLAAAVCVHRFLSAKDAVDELSSLKSVASWKRGQFIEDGGWSAMPDLRKSVEDVADVCAQRLAEMQPPQSQASGNGEAAGTAGTTAVQ